ncbi:Dph6-related ATP pyrophosphatase [Aliikangiella sp. IMCC44653]
MLFHFCFLKEFHLPHKSINVVLSWSSGKDSALALTRLLASPHYKVVGLFTTYVKEHIPFQEVPLQLVQRQAEAAELPLVLCELPAVFPSNEVYQALVVDSLKQAPLSFSALAFGDIFCNGIKEYRESFIQPAGWQCVFPLMNSQPADLANEVITSGIKAFINCVDTQQLSGEFLGREYDHCLLRDLPAKCDPCGENGEFHTFVYQADFFKQAINTTKTSKVDSRFCHHLLS